MEDANAASPQDVPRISSGMPHLDQILCGGWLRGGIYIVGGPPGTGKTTMGNHFCFAAAERGEPAIYVTMLAETHGRMMLHLRTLKFFRPEQVGQGVFYLSGFATLNEGGADALLELLQRTIRQRKARVLVIDGINLVRERMASPVAFRQFLQALSATASLTECTVLLLSTEETQKTTDVEYAMADGILTLSADLHGLKATRGLEVIKFRGSNNLPGKHTLLINEEGIHIYPRWEAVYTSVPHVVPDPGTRLSFGIPSLDAMCGGGLVAHSSTLILGSPGSGKTLIGLNFLANGAFQGEPGLYFGFAENAGTLLNKARSTGLDLEPLVRKDLLRLQVRAPVETLPDAMAQELMEEVKRHHVKRLMIDGLEPFAKEALDPERVTRFVSALFNALKDSGVTVLASQQTNTLFGPELHAPIQGVEAISDNILFLRFFELNGRLYRLISAMKMRDSDNDPYLRELVISSRGVEVRQSFEASESLITGQARGTDVARKPPLPAHEPPERPPKGKRPRRAAPRQKKPSRKGGRK